jgi:hypothetical protein
MPMNPRLLRPTSTSVHPEANAWRTAVVANGGSVSASTMKAVSKFCADIDKAGIRDRFYRLNLFAGTGLNACLVPLYRGPSRTGTQFGNTTDTNNGPFVSADYAENVGLTSDSSSKFLRTGMNIGDLDTVETGHMSLCYGGFPASQQNPIGAVSTSPLDRYTIQFNSATSTGGLWGSNLGAQATSGNALAANGMATITRRSATDLEYYENATSRSTAASSVTPTVGNIELHIFRTNLSTASFPAYIGRIRGYSVGRSVTAGQVADFYAAMKTFQDALGRTQT